MDFKVGSMVIVTDGKHRTISSIDGIKNGFLKVGCFLFDWCGNEVNVIYGTGLKIYPIEEKKSK